MEVKAALAERKSHTRIANRDRQAEAAALSSAKPAVDRRRHLGEAALRCILKGGSAGISVRQIAARRACRLG